MCLLSPKLDARGSRTAAAPSAPPKLGHARSSDNENPPASGVDTDTLGVNLFLIFRYVGYERATQSPSPEIAKIADRCQVLGCGEEKPQRQVEAEKAVVGVVVDGYNTLREGTGEEVEGSKAHVGSPDVGPKVKTR